MQNQIKALFNNNSSIDILLTSNTVVPVAAKHKSTVSITKISTVNATLHASSNAYTLHVQASAANIATNASNADNVVNFKAQQSKYTHDNDVHCLAMLNNKPYLQCFCNSASSAYYINGKEATKQEVAQYLTPAAADKLLSKDNVTHNQTHNIKHDVIIRTYKMSSIQSIQVLSTMQIINNPDFMLA